MFNKLKKLNLINRILLFFYKINLLEHRLSELESFIKIDEKDIKLKKFTLHEGNKKKLKGSWKRIENFSGYKRSRGFLSYKGYLFVGFSGGKNSNNGAIKKFKDNKWTDIQLPIKTDEIPHIIVHQKMIWFSSFSILNGASIWCIKNNKPILVKNWKNVEGALPIISFENKLYTSLVPYDKNDNGSPVLSFDGKNWKTIIKDHPYQNFYEFQIYEGKLFGCTMSSFWGGHVVEINTKNNSWKVVGGNGKNNSWTKISDMLRFALFENKLFVVGNLTAPENSNSYPNVWAYNGKKWFRSKKIQNMKAASSTYSFNALTFFENTLIIGCGGRPAGNARVYALNYDEWYQIGGDGINNSWSKNIFKSVNYPMTKKATTEYIYNFCIHDNTIITGFGASPNSGQVWQFVSN